MTRDPLNNAKIARLIAESRLLRAKARGCTQAIREATADMQRATMEVMRLESCGG